MCPSNVRRQSHGSGYQTLAQNLLSFQELRYIPMNIDIARLDEDPGIAETLHSHKASWHKSCFNKYSALKLARAQKRKSVEQKSSVVSELVSPKKTRSSFVKPVGIDAKSTLFFL